MNPNNNPSRQHRPNRWARLKKQLKQARAEADTTKRQRDWAHLFIALKGEWHEFSKWAQQQADGEAGPTDTLCNLYAQARQEAENTRHRLTIAQTMGKMYEEQKEGYYEMLGTQGAQVDKLMSIIENLTERVMKQCEEIQALKKQRQHNECNEATNHNVSKQ